jgi:hypothetical protein
LAPPVAALIEPPNGEGFDLFSLGHAGVSQAEIS